jgi:hypothetical protein
MSVRFSLPPGPTNQKCLSPGAVVECGKGRFRLLEWCLETDEYDLWRAEYVFPKDKQQTVVLIQCLTTSQHRAHAITTPTDTVACLVESTPTCNVYFHPAVTQPLLSETMMTPYTPAVYAKMLLALEHVLAQLRTECHAPYRKLEPSDFLVDEHNQLVFWNLSKLAVSKRLPTADEVSYRLKLVSAPPHSNEPCTLANLLEGTLSHLVGPLLVTL